MMLDDLLDSDAIGWGGVLLVGGRNGVAHSAGGVALMVSDWGAVKMAEGADPRIKGPGARLLCPGFRLPSFGADPECHPARLGVLLCLRQHQGQNECLVLIARGVYRCLYILRLADIRALDT